MHSPRLVGKQELIKDPAHEWQCENRASISPHLFLPGIIGRAIWFVIGEKERRPAESPPPQNTYCTKLKCVYKLLIINEILVEATGVELITMLTTRKLLILETATTAKKAPLPDPLYVYCTKMLFVLESHGSTYIDHSIL
jgi:hypothetical protein